MDTRSTSAGKHIGNDVWAGVGSSHGVGMGYSPTGTGGAVYAIGDDANVSLSLFGKGTGRTFVGNSSSPVIFSTNTEVQIGSTAPFTGFIRLSTDITTPSFSTAQDDIQVSTVTVPGANSSHFVLVNPANLSTAVLLTKFWVTSTANEVKMEFTKQPSTVAVAASTATFRILVFRF